MMKNEKQIVESGLVEVQGARVHNLKNIERIKPKRAFLIHMGHRFGLHAVMEKQMPENVFVAYDGLKINL